MMMTATMMMRGWMWMMVNNMWMMLMMMLMVLVAMMLMRMTLMIRIMKIQMDDNNLWCMTLHGDDWWWMPSSSQLITVTRSFVNWFISPEEFDRTISHACIHPSSLMILSHHGSYFNIMNNHSSSWSSCFTIHHGHHSPSHMFVSDLFNDNLFLYTRRTKS